MSNKLLDYQYDPDYVEKDSSDAETIKNGFCQWSTAENGAFIPANRTVEKIPAGFYEISHANNVGIFFKLIKTTSEDLIRFDDTYCEEVVQDIKKFWTLKNAYKSIGQTYKRGILLHGVPGGGKSSAIKIIVKDVIEAGGIAIKFQDPDYFKDGLAAMRRIEKDRQIVVLMEDIDGLLDDFSESDILNILDGVTNYENIVFLATTNHPDKLLGSITNRPSRFDRVFEFGPPNDKTREIYIKYLEEKFVQANKESSGVDVEKMIRDTKSLTIAHLKELFMSVAIFKYDYDSCLRKLKGMSEPIKPNDGLGGKRIGFDE